MNAVLNWKHGLSILWLGSNDITSDTDPDGLLDQILEICHAIEKDCQATVYVCQVEPRLYPTETPVTHEQYKNIQGGINDRLKRRLINKTINFHTCSFLQELAPDGVHWRERERETGKNRARSKLRKRIYFGQ